MQAVDLNDRYGRGRNYIVPISIAIAAIGIGWLLWAANFHSKPEIKTNVISYNALSPREIELSFEVIRKEPSKVFTCTLTGTDINHFVVGEIQREIKASERLITVRIPTRSTAAFAQVARCSR